jgi:hypothetical protein
MFRTQMGTPGRSENGRSFVGRFVRYHPGSVARTSVLVIQLDRVEYCSSRAVFRTYEIRIPPGYRLSLQKFRYFIVSITFRKIAWMVQSPF